MPVLNVGDTLAGKYRIERLLGKGGMGKVFLAENVAIGRRVAIKVLLDEDEHDPELIARFRGEARAAAAIGHPGIVDILDLGVTEDDTEFIVMEYLDGESLGDRIDRMSRLGVAEVTRLGGELLDALAAAHEAGVIHRDLKPDNIFLVARPVAVTKILDFGISKLMRGDDAALTSTGRIMGTPLYMSPEQGRGAKVDAATDVYSAGAVLYRALSGEPPVSGTSINEVITNLATVPPVPLTALCPNLPRALTTAIDSMIARRPEARPTARAAAAALRAAASGIGPVADGIAETAPRIADSAPRAAAAPRAGLDSTLGATASELGLAPTDPGRPRRSSSRVFLGLFLVVAAVATALIAFTLVRPSSSRSTHTTPADAPAAAIVSDAQVIAPPPVDAMPIDAALDAAATDASAGRPPRRKVDAGAGAPNFDDVKDQSPFKP